MHEADMAAVPGDEELDHWRTPARHFFEHTRRQERIVLRGDAQRRDGDPLDERERARLRKVIAGIAEAVQRRRSGVVELRECACAFCGSEIEA